MASSLKDTLQKKIDRRKVRPKKGKKKSSPFRGTWVMWSDKDPRWIEKGTSEVGGDHWPDEMTAKVKKLMRKFGNPPDDLEWEYRLE